MFLPIIMNYVSRINEDISTSCEATVLKVLLFHGRELFDLVSSTLILNASVDFILSRKGFEGPLM